MSGPPRPEPTGGYLRALLGKPFTAEQLAVATAPLRPQLVLAGAGAGKTTVMAARVVHAVAFHGVPPGSVLGLTFTNKAAGELADGVRTALDRLAAAAGPRVGAAGDEPAEDLPTVSTYHAYAAALLRDHALRVGREPDTTLLTDARRWQLALRVVRAARGPFEHLDWLTATVAQHVLDLDAEMSEHLVDVARVRDCDAALVAAVRAAPKSTVEVRSVLRTAEQREELLTLVERYRARKAELDLVDFGDQIAIAAQIATGRPAVAAGERDRFRVVFLDEYQDTGVAQRTLLAALFGAGHPVTAVGDPCQSIYGWRGASVGNLLRFAEHFPAVEVADVADPAYLLTSFRNGGRILDVANAVSAALRTKPPNRRRAHVDVPELRPAAGRGADGEVRVALHLTAVEEARWVADEVARAVHADGVPAGAVAVLCRRRSDFVLFQREIVARDVPVEVVGLGGLLTMPEVADVVAVLEVLADPTANPALVRIMTGPRYRIGPRDLAALGRRADHLVRSDGAGRNAVDPNEDPDGVRALTAATASVDPCDVVALTDALESLGDPTRYAPAAYARLRALDAELHRLRPLVAAPIVEAVTEVVAAIGLDVEIEAGPAPIAAARRANLAAFLDHAARFEGIEGESGLPGFLGYLAAAREKEDGLDVGGVSGADTVKLLTVHKAKGLEWDVVAVPCLAQDTFPSTQGRPRWTARAPVLPNRLRGDRADLPADPAMTRRAIETFLEQSKVEELAEERRLVYVAVTRARHRLLASGHVWSRTRSTPCAPSPFLTEIRDACLAGAGTVVCWAAEPGADGNPQLAAAPPDVAWPAPYDPQALAARHGAAELVQAALVGAALDGAALDGAALADEPDGDPARVQPTAPWRWETDTLLAEVGREGAGDRRVALPVTLTASQLVRLAADPDELARSLARPMPRRPSPQARRGTAFHAWVEGLFGARPLLEEDELAGAGDADLPEPGDLAALRAAFARTEFAERAPYAVEAPFSLALGGWLLRGRIDAVYRTAGGYDVLDWKTGLRPADPRAAALQLAVYRLAWAGIAGVPVAEVTAGFLYVRTGELVRPEWLPDAAGLERLLRGSP